MIPLWQGAKEEGKGRYPIEFVIQQVTMGGSQSSRVQKTDLKVIPPKGQGSKVFIPLPSSVTEDSFFLVLAGKKSLRPRVPPSVAFCI